MFRKNSNGGYSTAGVICGVVVALVVVFGVIKIGSSYFQRRTVNVVVQDKERVCSGGNNGTSCKYLIFTDHGTFRLTDSLAIGRFSSSDAYGRIRVCHSYELKVYGWRFGPTSSYPNIVKTRDEGKVQSCEDNR